MSQTAVFQVVTIQKFGIWAASSQTDVFLTVAIEREVLNTV